LLRKAIHQRWPIPSERRQAIFCDIASIIESGDHRRMRGAGFTLMVMVRADLINFHRAAKEASKLGCLKEFLLAEMGVIDHD
jgi:hypothetical protein